MSIRAERPTWVPSYPWWGMLATVMAAGVFGGWAIATGLLILLLAQVARPFDFIAAFLLVTVGAVFVRYSGGELTRQLGLLTVAILFMLSTYVLRSGAASFRLGWSGLTIPLLAYVGLTIANFARGLSAGYPPKSAGLELIAALALGSALLVANAFEARRDLRLAVVGLVAIAFATAAPGLYQLSIIHERGGYLTPVPGMIAMLPVNLALRAERPRVAIAWTLLAAPLLLHQFLSFTRGYWLGCLAGLMVSFLIYPGLGRGSGARWARAGPVLWTLAGMTVVVLSTVLYLGQSSFLELAAKRFASIADTELSGETYSYSTMSTWARLVEYATALKHIAQAPWFGHGVGFTFLVQQPVGFRVFEQWWVHQNYLLVWLKQGLLGLMVFVWMIGAAVALGVRESRRREPGWESAWLATAAATTIFLAVLALTNFHLALVNTTFPLALQWGAAMAMARDGFVWFRWSDAPGASPGVRDTPITAGLGKGPNGG